MQRAKWVEFVLAIADKALHEAVIGCLGLRRNRRINGSIHFIDTSHGRQLFWEVLETVKSSVLLLQNVLLSSDAVLHELHPVQLGVGWCLDVWDGSSRCLCLACDVAGPMMVLASLGMKR